MQILICRDNQRFGPYTLDVVHAYLASGQIQLSDWAWYEGSQDWVPLAQVPGIQQPSQLLPPPPPPATRQIQPRQASGSGALVCPHCQTRGSVTTKQIKQKRGISGGKATAALLTGGISLLAVGLSRKEKLTQAHCKKCGSTWVF